MPENLKVLILTERFYPEEFIINELVFEWKKQGLNPAVLTQTPSYPFGKIFKNYKNRIFQEETVSGVKIYRFATVTGYHKNLFLKLLNYANFAALGLIAAVLVGKNYDKIFVYQTGPLTLALPAIAIKKLWGKEVTIWTQYIWPDAVYAYGFKKNIFLSLFLDFIIKTVYSNCRHIMVSCGGFAAKIRNYTPGREIIHVPNWSTVNDYPNDLNPMRLSDKFNFTFAGNTGKLQNLENVIKGFSAACGKNKKMQLNIIGDGSNLETLKNLAAAENCKNVVFWGRKKLGCGR